MTDTAKTRFLTKVSKLPKFGDGICLERLGWLLEGWVEPDFAKVLVITGSNGKGTTSMMVDSILRAGGVRTGLFTSPHFLEFNERFKVDGVEVDYETLDTTFDEVLAKAEGKPFGVFELLFALAVVVFSRAGVEVVVFEAGIGGRYDPVAWFKSSLTALTSVDLEHTNILGDTVEAIAEDKLDACREGGTTVLGNVSPALATHIREYCAGRSVLLIEAVTDVSNGTPLDFNRQTAIALCGAFYGDSIESGAFEQQCQQGIEHCRIPGRFEQIADKPVIFIDSAHSPQAYELLFDEIKRRFAHQPLVLVVGQSEGRDIEPLAAPVAELAQSVIVTKACFKGAAPSALAASIEALNPGLAVRIEADLPQAMSQAKTWALDNLGVVFVVGGLFLAAEAAAVNAGLAHEDLFLY